MTNGVRKQTVLDQFATFVNPQKVRVMKAAGLDIIEGERSGPGCGTSTALGISTASRRRVVQRRPEAPEGRGGGTRCRRPPGQRELPALLRAEGELAAKLAEVTPGDLSCTMFGTGGGEAIDFAVKLARGAPDARRSFRR